MCLNMATIKFITLLTTMIIQVHLSIAADLPAVYIFGDSTADVGTNNNLKGSLATADNPYYGIDYPSSKPTGRFSNGYNTVDEIVKQLGGFRESPLPFLSLMKHKSSINRKVVHGVNFASGGSGILVQTGFTPFKNVTSLEEQVQQFATVSEMIKKVLGPAKAKCHLQNSLYIISVGSNDFFDLIQYGSNLSTPQYLANLQNTYASHLQSLYARGARKFGVVSVAPIGCVPAILYKTGGICLPQLEDLAQAFYPLVQTLLQNFTSSHDGVHYSLGNAYNMTKDIIDNPGAGGFTNVTSACCGTGAFNGKDKCTPTSNLCSNRTQYLFWDWFHPTQEASKLAAEILVNGTIQKYVSPINFSQLAAIHIA